MKEKFFAKIIAWDIYLLGFLIVFIVAINSIIHDPIIGYDADGHLDYIQVVADHLPGEEESGEFFSPPLPYYLPGVAYQACEAFSDMPWGQCKLLSGHFAKGINWLLAIGMIIFFVKISDLLRPNNKNFIFSVLLVFGSFPVFYKTFSQVRGEPYVAFFTLMSVFFALKLYKASDNRVGWNVAWLGISLGLLILSRQWGFLLFPAFFILLISSNKFPFKKRLFIIVTVFLIAAVVGGWFYLHLYFEYGSITAFNMEGKAFSFSNQPLSFYQNVGIRNFILFRSPTRKTFDNMFIPLFYSEIWGDYWGYFVFIKNSSTFFVEYANKEQITPYLGRVNFVSLFPTTLLMGGLLIGIKSTYQSIRRKLHHEDRVPISFFFLAILFSMLGFFWFLVKYPLLPKGATIKATYMIQIFVLLPFLAAEFLEFIRRKTLKGYYLVLLLLGVVFIHNLPVMISRHWWWRR